jgi:hypothetical protein
MLDHLTGTISSTHIPTGASAMHAAELMLSHLDVPPDAPAPLRFVNDTLVSTYSPKPWNKVASIWLIRATTRVEDMCPAKKLHDVSWPERIDRSGQLITSGRNHASLLAIFSLPSRLTLGIQKASPLSRWSVLYPGHTSLHFSAEDRHSS